MSVHSLSQLSCDFPYIYQPTKSTLDRVNYVIGFTPFLPPFPTLFQNVDGRHCDIEFACISNNQSCIVCQIIDNSIFYVSDLINSWFWEYLTKNINFIIFRFSDNSRIWKIDTIDFWTLKCFGIGLKILVWKNIMLDFICIGFPGL